MKKITAFILFLCACAFCVTAGLPAFADVIEPEEETAQLSPEFLRWQREQQSSLNDRLGTGGGSPASGSPTGYIPDPVDLSHLADNPPRPELEVRNGQSVLHERAGAGSLPATYDLRTSPGRTWLTGVKNQNPYGTCWAFASIGAMESNYLSKTSTALDLSELHMAWFVYKDPQTGRAFTLQSSSQYGNGVLNQGGNASMSIAYLSRMAGPTLETNLPYSDITGVSTVKNITGSTKPEDYTRALRLKEAYTLGDVTASNRDLIKEMIQKYGAVQISYYAGDNAVSPTGSTTAYYENSGSTPNHAVLLVGWDDNYSRTNFGTQPSSNGAWLVRNSWGTSWGDSGYFYMSYEQNIVRATVYIVEAYDSSLQCYSHDPLGFLGYAGSFSSSSGKFSWAANVFQAQDNETLKEVAFYTADNNVAYEIYIYDLGTTKPSAPAAVSPGTPDESGTLAYAGYHTVGLTNPVTLSKGHYFSVVMKLTNPSGSTAGVFATETAIANYAGNVVVNAGESYFASTLSSLTSPPSPSQWADGYSKGINACIKAFTVPSSTAPVTPTAPSIQTESLPDGTRGAAYSATLTATGTAPVTWSLNSAKGVLPNGLTLNPSTGVISGTPTNAGVNNFTVIATNSAGTDSKALKITVNEPGTVTVKPTITTGTLPGGTVNTAYSAALNASGTTPITWSVDSGTVSSSGTRTASGKTGSLPTGLTLNSSTGVISGTPTTAGTHSFTVTATNTAGSDSKTLSIVVASSVAKPVITTTGLPGGTVGVAYSTTLTATGGGTITWARTSGSLPTGLTLNGSTGLISGTPTKAGTFSFTVRAANSAGSVTKALSIRVVNNPIVKPTISTSSLPNGTVGASYSATLTAKGTTPITWTKSGGTLPPGLSLSTAGKITGSPTTAGTYTFTARADNSGGYAAKSLRIIVKDAKPVITTSTLPDGKVGEAYSATLTATGSGTIKWARSGGTLPTGLSLSTAGKITGKPTKGGTFSFTARATNSGGYVTKSLKITVRENAPSITTASLPGGTVSKSYSAVLAASGTNIKWTRSGGTLPTGLSLSTAGKITGKTTKAGTFSFTVKAANSGGSDTKALQITVQDQKPAISTSSLTNGTVGKAYSVVLKGTGTNLTWTVSGGALPSGLSLSTAGKITGKPTASGTYTFTVKAENSGGSATRSLRIIVRDAKPVISTSSLSNATIQTAYSAALKATGANITWTKSGGTLPTGLSLNGSTGVISGTPTKAGTFSFTVKASNSGGYAARSLRIIVKDVKPTISTSSLSSGTVGQSYSQTLEGTGTNVKWTKSGGTLPTGLSLSTAGKIASTPKKAGTYSFTVKASNSAGSATKTFKIVITDAKTGKAKNANETDDESGAADNEPDTVTQEPADGTGDDTPALNKDKDMNMDTDMEDEGAQESLNEDRASLNVLSGDVLLEGDLIWAAPEHELSFVLGSWTDSDGNGAPATDLEVYAADRPAGVEVSGDVFTLPSTLFRGGDEFNVYVTAKSGGQVLKSTEVYVIVRDNADEAETSQADAPGGSRGGCDAGILGMSGLMAPFMAALAFRAFKRRTK